MKNIKIRLAVGKEYANYFISIAMIWKVVKVGLKNIITSYYQITGVFKLMFSIWQHAGSKGDRK